MVIILNYLNSDGVNGDKNIVINGGFEKQFLSKTTKIINNVKNNNHINNPVKNNNILHNKTEKMEKLNKSNKLLNYINNVSQNTFDNG